MTKPSRDCRTLPNDSTGVNTEQPYALLPDLADYVGCAELSEIIPFLESRSIIAQLTEREEQQ